MNKARVFFLLFLTVVISSLSYVYLSSRNAETIDRSQQLAYLFSVLSCNNGNAPSVEFISTLLRNSIDLQRMRINETSTQVDIDSSIGGGDIVYRYWFGGSFSGFVRVCYDQGGFIDRLEFFDLFNFDLSEKLDSFYKEEQSINSKALTSLEKEINRMFISKSNGNVIGFSDFYTSGLFRFSGKEFDRELDMLRPLGHSD